MSDKDKKTLDALKASAKAFPALVELAPTISRKDPEFWKPGTPVRFMDPLPTSREKPFGYIARVAHVDLATGPEQSACALCKAGSPKKIYVLKRRTLNPNAPDARVNWDFDAMTLSDEEG